MTHYTKGTPSQDWTPMTISKVRYRPEGCLSACILALPPGRNAEPQMHRLEARVAALETRVGAVVEPEPDAPARFRLVAQLQPRAELERPAEIGTVALGVKPRHHVELGIPVPVPRLQRVAQPRAHPGLAVIAERQAVDRAKGPEHHSRVAPHIGFRAGGVLLEHDRPGRYRGARRHVRSREAPAAGAMLGAHRDEPEDKTGHGRRAVGDECEIAHACPRYVSPHLWGRLS